jgi:hypothetical protein
MPTKITNILALCSVLSALTTSVARQTTPSHELTTPDGPHVTDQHTTSTPTTPVTKFKYSLNNPFRIFSPPSAPVCCLVSLPTAQPDPHPTDELLSFEEWKERQLAQRQAETSETTATVTNTAEESASVPETTSNILIPVIETSDPPPIHPIADFVPIQGRFNYASLDCSARVHSSHKSMKSASSILSSKKDKYMLAPCSADRTSFHLITQTILILLSRPLGKHIVVELCDDIRVDTVQLSNFEFFSGVFKDITISLAQTATVGEGGGEVMGVYEAKNIRGVQVRASGVGSEFH